MVYTYLVNRTSYAKNRWFGGIPILGPISNVQPEKVIFLEILFTYIYPDFRSYKDGYNLPRSHLHIPLRVNCSRRTWRGASPLPGPSRSAEPMTTVPLCASTGEGSAKPWWVLVRAFMLRHGSGHGTSRRFMKQKCLSPVIHVDDSENLMLLRFIYQHI